MTIFLSIVVVLVFLVLWSLAWRRSPALAFGMFLGMIGVCVLGAILRPSGIEHVPIWLPALPFTVVAITLFYFGVLAWFWGNRRS